jgi:hypothetical protein
MREMAWHWRLDYHDERQHESLGNLPTQRIPAETGKPQLSPVSVKGKWTANLHSENSLLLDCLAISTTLWRQLLGYGQLWEIAIRVAYTTPIGKSQDHATLFYSSITEDPA